MRRPTACPEVFPWRVAHKLNNTAVLVSVKQSQLIKNGTRIRGRGGWGAPWPEPSEVLN